MSYCASWRITGTLEGDWPRETRQNLNKALQWWGDWCESSDFFRNWRFVEGPFREVAATYTNGLSFDMVLDFSVNGDQERMLKGGWPPLAEREGFDREVHQELLFEMEVYELSILFENREDHENEGDIRTERYRLTSNGERFIVVEILESGGTYVI